MLAAAGRDNLQPRTATSIPENQNANPRPGPEPEPGPRGGESRRDLGAGRSILTKPPAAAATLVLESKRREAVERVEVTAHRRRIGLPFSGLPRRLAQPVQVEFPPVAALRTRPRHPGQVRERDRQLHRP